jgi:ABC-type Fe3+-hydroxamate transport system substrate-binding protein
MDSKTTKVIVIIVAVIAVAAIAAFVLMNNNNGGNNDDDKPGSYSFRYMDLYEDEFDYWKLTRLAVLGNANNDTTIDSKDVAYIKNVIRDGDISYKENNNKYSELYMCDANSNGTINAEDAKFVQDMIDGKVTTIYYEKLLDGIGSYTPAKKTYLVPIHRCYARAAVLIANASDNVTIVGGDTQLEEDEFKSLIDFSKFESVGTTSTVSTEKISSLSAKYSDGNVVVMTGSTVNYCPDYEDKGTHAQYLRFISWEGDALTGLLTAAYLIDGVGNSDGKDGTAWGKAKEYEEWYLSYINLIKEQGAKVKESDKRTVLMPYLTPTVNGVDIPGGDQSSLTLRGNNTAEELFIENAGGINLYYEIGEPNSYGRVTYTMELLTKLTKKDILTDVIFMPTFFVADGTNPGAQAWDAEKIQACEDGIAEAFSRYIASDVDVYIKTWRLNGIPMIMDQIAIAKVLLPDNAVIEGLDVEKIWNEYLDLIGASKTSNLRFSNVFIMDEEPFHTLP